MHACSEPALYLLEEINLISASIHAVDLDLETLWDAHLPSSPPIAGAVGPSGGYPIPACPAALRKRLFAVLIHAWPQPRDPVVVGLVAQARHMLGQLDRAPNAVE